MWFCVRCYYCLVEGTWRALGVGKPGDGETLRENISCPCWASQLWNAEPFANSIDWLICSECSQEWSGVERTLPCGAFSPLDGTTEAASRRRHAREIGGDYHKNNDRCHWYISMWQGLLLNAVHALFHLTLTGFVELSYCHGSYLR